MEFVITFMKRNIFINSILARHRTMPLSIHVYDIYRNFVILCTFVVVVVVSHASTVSKPAREECQTCYRRMLCALRVFLKNVLACDRG